MKRKALLIISTAALWITALGAQTESLPTEYDDFLSQAPWTREMKATADVLFAATTFELSPEQRMWLVDNVRDRYLPPDPDNPEKQHSSSSYRQAAVAITNHVRSNPQDKMLLFVAADYYTRGNDHEGAARAYEDGISAYPDIAQAAAINNFLSRYYLQKEYYEKALFFLGQAVKKGIRDGTTYGLLGFIYLKNEDLSLAEAAYREAIIKDPENKNWKLSLAQVLRNEDKFAEANAIVNEMIIQDPNDEQLWLFQANNYLSLDRMLDAAKNYEILYRMGKAKSESQMLLGRIYINNDMIDLAHEAFMNALDLPKKPSIDESIQSASMLRTYASFEQVMAYINKIRSAYADQVRDKDELKLLTIESQLYISRDEGQKAIATLERILDIDPDSTEALMTLGIYYLNQDNERRAEEVLTRAIENSRSANDETIEKRALVSLGQLKVRQKDYYKARELLERAFELEPSDNLADYIERVNERIKYREATIGLDEE